MAECFVGRAVNATRPIYQNVAVTRGTVDFGMAASGPAFLPGV
jgi:hypothetical protein